MLYESETTENLEGEELYVAPASFAQTRFWLLDRLAPGLPTYNVPLAVRLSGPLSAGCLAAALADLVARHEALRTALSEGDAGEAGDAGQGEEGEPVQLIHPELTPALPEIDLAALPAPRAEEEALRAARGEAARPFDLARAPLFRASLFRLAEREHLLLLNFHHAVIDAVSLGIVVRELFAAYEARAQGRPPSLPELPLQYADYAAWQRGWLVGEALEQKLRPFRRRLAGALPELALFADRPRLPGASPAGAVLAFTLPAPLVAGLAEAGRAAKATPFMVLLASFFALLARHTGQEDLLVGTPVANRTRREIEDVVGLFANTLVLRGDLAGDPAWGDLLARVRAVLVEALAHEDLPFEKLVEALRPERRADRTPLFRVALALQPAALPEEGTGGLGKALVPLHSGTAKFDLSLQLVEGRRGLSGFWEYATALFDRTTIRRLAGHWQSLLAAAVADPGRRLGELPLLAPAERHQLTLGWNDTAAEYPREATLPELFAAQAARTPGAPALATAEGSMTYRELDRRARRLARRLAGVAGIPAPEAPVGVCLESGAERVVAFLGILYAGGAYLPLDPGYPEERLALMVAEAAVSTVLTRERLRGRLPAGVAVLSWEEIDLEGDGEDEPAGGEPWERRATPLSLAYVLYTSGSTGRPKGVAVPHRAVIRLVLGTGYVRLGPEVRMAQAANASFDAVTFEIWGALLHGGCLVLVEREVTLAPEELAPALRDRGVTTLFLTTALFHRMASADPASFRTLSDLLFGGEAIEAGRVAEVLAAGPPGRLLHVYGPTEGTTFSTWHRLRPLHAVPPGATTLPIGRPLANTRAFLLDRWLQPAPIGAAGEIFLGGDGLARGYLGRPELTALRFVPSPLGPEPGARLYKTGDLARFLPDGAIEFRGRADSQVKIRGFRIEPAEVETALAAHPAVAECAVVARDRRGAQAREPGAARELALVAYVAPRRGASLGPRELRDFLAGKLPDYMVPASFVELAALPKTPNGKVDRAALPEPAAAGPLSPGYVAPRNPLEEVLAGIWAWVLRLGPESRIGAHDNFFDLGGHSLTATLATAQARQAFAVDLPTRALFESPTLSELAREIEELLLSEQGLTLPPMVRRLRLPEDPDPPLSFSQQRLWFLDELSEGESPFHNIAASLLLAGRLDVAALGRALSSIVRRHEALRTTFRSSPDGSPRQVIHPPSPLVPTLADLSALPQVEAEALARRLASAEAHRPFSLARGPLLRADLLRLGPERHVLTLSVHHIVADGWSLEILVGELSALYAGSAPLPALPIQYADFAVWQRSWLAGPVLETQLDYWRRQLAGAPQVLELAADRPRPAVQTYRGAALPLALPAELTDRLDALSRERRATPFMALFAAFAALLGRITGQDDLLLGSPIAGRTRPEVRELIGFFVNMLLLRADLAGRPSFRQLLDRARETALGAYTHQDLPFERLVEELQPGRDPSRNPLFQVSFALAGTPWHALSLPGLTLEHREADTETELFDLSCDLTRAADGLSGRLSWNRDLFDPATVRRLSRQLGALLSGLVAEPDRPVAALPLLSPAERREVEAGLEGRPEEAAPASVVALFGRRVAEQPASPAFAWAGGAEVSYEELDRRTNRLARRLRALGVGPETVVALQLVEPADFALAVLAVWKAGGAYLPLVAELPEERQAMLLADSRARVVITRRPADAAGPEGSGCGRCSSRPSGSGCAPSSPDPSGPAHVDLESDRFLLARESPEPLGEEPAAESAAYVLYTSGSTGVPKGVVVPHGALALHAVGFAERLGLSSADRVLLFTSFAFDVSLDELVPTLLAGGVLLPWRPRAAEPMEMARVLGETGATVVNLPTALWHLAARTWSAAPPPALRWMLVGGEAMPPGALGLWRRSPFGGVPLLHGYGTTETVITSTVHQAPEREGRDLVHFSVGRPLPGRTVRLLDEEGELVPPGVPGEIHLGGPALARGYLGRPDRTAATFVPDPWSRAPGARLYRTGDLGRRRESGEVEVLGRRDRQVKLRGVRIEIGEIEAALSAHPAVREAAVVLRESGAEDAPERKALVAYVSGTEAPAAAELKAFLSRRLPASMVPAAYVSLPDLPKTPGGKIDRSALALAPVPPVPAIPAESASREATEPLPIPAGPSVEEIVAALWREILQVPAVGLDDNFFDLGGHSMLMAVVRARLLAELAVDLSLLDLYSHPTVRGLGELLRQKSGAPEQAPAAEPAPRVRVEESATGDSRGTEIAIVGMAGRFPGADDLPTFWQNLRAGVDSITFFLPPGESWQPPPGGSFLVPAAGALSGADLWDADFFGASRREAEMMDPQQRLFLECAWEAWENAGYAPQGYPGRVGVFGGASKTDYAFLLAVSGAMDSLEGSRLGGVGTERDFLTTRVSYKLGLTGPSVSLQTACSTSLVAVDLACRSLLSGDCGMALAGGVSVSARQRWGYFHQEGGNLSPDGRCRAFDGEGQGSVDSDGVGIVVLKRLADALADGDTVRAVIRTSVVGNDGGDRPGGFLAPSLEGRTALVRRALELSGVPAESITYVEGHGNGTRLGDAIELVATTRAFRAFTDRVGFCALGSVKSNLGHANGAAGIASLIKTVLALEHREIPPTLHFIAAAPEAAIAASPFFVNTRLLPWENDGFPRRAGVTALAAGGTNAHLILEEAPPAPSPPPMPGWQLLPLSARTATALESMAARLAEHLHRHPDLSLPDVAWTLQVGREAFEHRRAVLCRDLGEAVAALSRPAGLDGEDDWGTAGEAEPLADLGRRWLAGAAVDWAALHAGERRRRLPLPTYPFERRRYWIDEGEAGHLLRQLPHDPGATAELSGFTPGSRSSAPPGPPGATAGRRR